MSFEEKEDLYRRLKRFESMSDAQQQRIRALHAEIAADPNDERLLAVVEAYDGWLNGLSSEEYDEHRERTSDERIAWMRSTLSRGWETSLFGYSDAALIESWFDQWWRKEFDDSDLQRQLAERSRDLEKFVDEASRRRPGGKHGANFAIMRVKSRN